MSVHSGMSTTSNVAPSQLPASGDDMDGFEKLVSEGLNFLRIFSYEAVAGVSIVGIITNLFHLTVLTRRSMRTSSINIFMAGISICELITMTCNASYVVREHYRKYMIATYHKECFPSMTYAIVLHNTIVNTFGEVGQEIAAWFGITMAVFRAVIIKYPMSLKIRQLGRPLFGVSTLITVTFFLSPFLYITSHQTSFQKWKLWTAPEHCKNYPPNYSEWEYVLHTGDLFSRNDGMAYWLTYYCDGIIFKLIPAVVLPVTSFILIFELKKINKERERVVRGSNEKETCTRTTKLVLFLSVFSFFAFAPLGMLYLFHIVAAGSNLESLITDLVPFFTLFQVINGTSHCFLCFFMSSQYRTTARALFCWNKKNGNKVLANTTLPPRIPSSLQS